VRVFPLLFGIALILLGAFFLLLTYYAVESIWGYDREGAQWQYALLAAGELLAAAWLLLNGSRMLRAGVTRWR
jgi:hypothetical protein